MAFGSYRGTCRNPLTVSQTVEFFWGGGSLTDVVPVPLARGLLSLTPEGVRQSIRNLNLIFKHQKFVIYRNLAKNNRVVVKKDNVLHPHVTTSKNVRCQSFSLQVGLTVISLPFPSRDLGPASRVPVQSAVLPGTQQAVRFLGFGERLERGEQREHLVPRRMWQGSEVRVRGGPIASEHPGCHCFQWWVLRGVLHQRVDPSYRI